MMYHWLRCFKLGTHAKDGEIHELNETDLDQIKELIVGLDKDDEHKRYHAWLKEIKEGSAIYKCLHHIKIVEAKLGTQNITCKL